MKNEFKVKIISDAKLNECFEAFAGVEKFVAYHPNAKRYEKLTKDTNNRTFKIYEKPYWFTPTIYFIAEFIPKQEDKKVEMNAELFKYIKIKIDFSFHEVDGKTHIHEDVKVNYNFPIKHFLNLIFWYYHHKLVKNIK